MPYRDRVEYRPPRRSIAHVNRWVARLAVLGLTPRNTIALEVPGRRTGKSRRTALVYAEYEGSRYLVSLPGESSWVRNVRAAGYRAKIRRLKATPVTLEEVRAEERPPIIRAYLSKRAYSKSPEFEAREFFGITPTATDEELAKIAPRYPVFRIVERQW
jgi:deazaflavin-dependent oxidoreductase (nitroreductase family)